MSWIAGRRAGLPAERMAPSTRLDERQGSLLVEIDLARLEPADFTIFQSAAAWGASIRLRVQGADRLWLEHGTPCGCHRLSVGFDRVPPFGIMRITYSWDRVAGRALLTAENLHNRTLRQQESSCRADWSPAGAAAGLAAGDTWHACLNWLAVADHVHPVGIIGALAADAGVETPAGRVAARALRRGDLVLTHDAGPQPVLWQGGLTVPAWGSLQPIRIRAPYLGARSDILVQPAQRILRRGGDVEFLFGEDEVLAPAALLVDGRAAHAVPGAPTVTWHGILLPGHHLIEVDGCPMESLCIGSLAANPGIAATTVLAPLAAAGGLPRHRQTVRRELQGFEAAMLARAAEAARRAA